MAFRLELIEGGLFYAFVFAQSHLTAINCQIVAGKFRPASTVKIMGAARSFCRCLVRVSTENRLTVHPLSQLYRLGSNPLRAAQKDFAPALSRSCEVMRSVQTLQKSVGKVGAGSQDGMPINKLVKTMTVMD